jgi:phosphatidylinositol 4-kinase
LHLSPDETLNSHCVFAFLPFSALGKLKHFDTPREPQTPTAADKEHVEVMVNTALVNQLDLPSLDCTGNPVATEEGNPKEEGLPGKPSFSRQNRNLSAQTNRKMSAFGSDAGDVSSSLPNHEIRREVLTAIMTKGMSGSHTIAAGAALSAQKSLQDLDRRRAVDMILHGDEPESKKCMSPGSESRVEEAEAARKKLLEIGLDQAAIAETLEEDAAPALPSEEDEAMEALRLLLLQNRVGQGTMSLESAAMAMAQPVASSIRNIGAPREGEEKSGKPRHVDKSEMIEIDAGDVDPRLSGCGALPPAVLSALTLWKAEVVSNGELLELVKKDLNYIRHAGLDDEDTDKLIENSQFWGRFAFGERWAEKKARIAASSPHGTELGWDLIGVIIKSNDDLRQEAFVMQLIELCDEAFQLAGLELWLHPYRVLATGRTTGVIEMVKNAMSFDSLKKRPGYGKGGLREHLKRMTEYTADPADAFRSAQRNFVSSLAAYSLLSYFFLFKDRHNGNILLDTAGHVIHIDFGFVFGVAPGGSFSLEMSTPFKLTEEMMEVMGGMESPLFSEFVTLFCCGFLALQAHVDTFATIVEITCRESSFKCFDGKEADEVVSKLRERFAADLGKEASVAYALDLIKQATKSYGTKQYDYFQYLSQGIAA